MGAPLNLDEHRPLIARALRCYADAQAKKAEALPLQADDAFCALAYEAKDAEDLADAMRESSDPFAEPIPESQ